jgi:excisionase family DNA binding protein
MTNSKSKAEERRRRREDATGITSTLYTVREAAAILHASEITVRALIKSGRLRAERMGIGGPRSPFRVDAAAIAEYRAQRRVVVATPPAATHDDIYDDTFR